MEIVGHRSAIDKSAGFRSDDHIKIQILDLILHLVDRQLHSFRILKYRGDITEQNAGLREIRDHTDILVKIIHKTLLSLKIFIFSPPRAAGTLL